MKENRNLEESISPASSSQKNKRKLSTSNPDDVKKLRSEGTETAPTADTKLTHLAGADSYTSFALTDSMEMYSTDTAEQKPALIEFAEARKIISGLTKELFTLEYSSAFDDKLNNIIEQFQFLVDNLSGSVEFTNPDLEANKLLEAAALQQSTELIVYLIDSGVKTEKLLLNWVSSEFYTGTKQSIARTVDLVNAITNHYSTDPDFIKKVINATTERHNISVLEEIYKMGGKNFSLVKILVDHGADLESIKSQGRLMSTALKNMEKTDPLTMNLTVTTFCRKDPSKDMFEKLIFTQYSSVIADRLVRHFKPIQEFTLYPDTINTEYIPHVASIFFEVCARHIKQLSKDNYNLFKAKQESLITSFVKVKTRDFDIPADDKKDIHEYFFVNELFEKVSNLFSNLYLLIQFGYIKADKLVTDKLKEVLVKSSEDLDKANKLYRDTTSKHWVDCIKSKPEITEVEEPKEAKIMKIISIISNMPIDIQGIIGGYVLEDCFAPKMGEDTIAVTSLGDHASVE